MRKRTLTFGAKLGISAGILGIVIVLLAWVGLHELSAMSDTLHLTIDVNARKANLAGALNTAESDMAAAERGVILFSYAKDANAVSKADALFQASSTNFQRALA